MLDSFDQNILLELSSGTQTYEHMVLKFVKDWEHREGIPRLSAEHSAFNFRMLKLRNRGYLTHARRTQNRKAQVALTEKGVRYLEANYRPNP